MRNIEKYIPIALKALENNTIKIVDFDGKIDGTYNGYISSFGASIITSGLLPTFIFYSKRAENNREVDRSQIVKALEFMLKDITINLLNANETILNKVKNNHSDSHLKQKIQECAIALKLAIRTYPKK
jgi:CRISPR-associated protein Cmr5